MAQMNKGRAVAKVIAHKKKIRKLTIIFMPDESKSIEIIGNEDFTLFENYTLVATLERMLFKRLVDKYEKETGDSTGNDSKIEKWLSKQK